MGRRNIFTNKVSQVPDNQCYQSCTKVFQFHPILMHMLPLGFLDLTDFQVFIMVGLIPFLVIPLVMEFILGTHGLEFQCASHLLLAGSAWGTWE